MALIRTSAIVGQIRNSVAGVTFTRCGAGAVVRSRVRPTRNPTQNQVRTTAIHSIKSAFWRTGLSEANRIEWNTAALAVRWTNALGDDYTPSGFQLFMRQSSPIPHQPAAFPTVPVQPLKTPSPPVYLWWNEANDHIYIRTWTNQPPPANGWLTIWHSKTLPPTWYHHGGPTIYTGIRTFTTGVMVNHPITSADPIFRPCRVWFRILASLTRYTQSQPLLLSISIPPAP